MSFIECTVCGRRVPGDGPAVGTSIASGRSSYVPFVEDLRTSSLSLAHIACYADSRGVESLVEVLHRHDTRVRAEIFDLLSRVGATNGD
jgi:hypothetical protein